MKTEKESWLEGFKRAKFHEARLLYDDVKTIREETAKQIFTELDEWMARFGVKSEYDKIKSKFLKEIPK